MSKIKSYNQFVNEGVREQMIPKSKEDILKYIKKLNKDKKTKLLYDSVMKKDLETARFLLDNGADIEVVDCIPYAHSYMMSFNKEIRELVDEYRTKKPINKLKKFFHFNEAITWNFNKPTDEQRYKEHLDRVMGAKVGDVLDHDDIYQYVEYLTIQAGKYEYSFVDGDLAERIEEYSEYALKELLLDALDLDEWDVDKDIANEYRLQYLKGKDYPPIVVDAQYSIIDGIHRANGLKRAGLTKILAFVGLEK